MNPTERIAKTSPCRFRFWGPCLFLFLYLMFPGTVHAAQTRVLQQTFGAATSTQVDPAPLREPQGIAVNDTSGDVYVADMGNNRVEKFGPGGEFLLAFGFDVNKAKSEPGSLASQEQKDVCTAVEVGMHTTECQAGTSGSAPGAFTTAKFIAIDQTTNDVYVADTADNIVSKFSAEGVLEESWGTKGQLNGSTTGPKEFGPIAGIAVGMTGRLYVFNAIEPGYVFEFESDSKFLSEVELKTEYYKAVTPVGVGVNAAGDIFKNDSGYMLEFNPAGAEIMFVNNALNAGMFTIEPKGDLYYAGSGSSIEHYEFSVTGEVVEPGGSFCPGFCGASDSSAVGFVGSGIAVNASGDTFLSNSADGKVGEYSGLLTVPDAKTEAANPKEVGGRKVTLNGMVNPEGLPVTKCFFEYGTTTAYGHTQPCKQSEGEIGSGTGEVPVSAEIEGLTPGVTYDYRLVVANEHDEHEPATPVQGENLSVETQPAPSIEPESQTVTALTATSATLNAQIDTHDLKTGYRFEYAETEAQLLGGEGARVADGEHGEVVQEGSTAAGTSDAFVSVPIALKAANTRYYWRVVAKSESGTTTTLQQTFIYTTTSTGLDASALPDDRAYEMVSPNRKNGALLGDVSLGLPPEVGASGERVMTDAIQCFGGARSCHAQTGNIAGSPYQFARSDEAGVCAPAAPPCWHTTPLSPSASEFAQSAMVEYTPEGEGAALFSIPTIAPPLSEGENDFYVREPSGTFVDLGPSTPPQDGAQGPHGGALDSTTQVSTADLSHFAWDAHYSWSFPFEYNAQGFDEVFEYAPGEKGKNRHLDVGVSGRYENGANHNLICGSANLGESAQAMSADGRTVFFRTNCPTEAVFGSTEEVFARVDGEQPDAHTVALSEPDAPQTAGESPPDQNCASQTCKENIEKQANWHGERFLGASADGSDAFFTSTQQLTDHATEDTDSEDDATEEGKFAGCAATVGENGCNLYEYRGVGGTHPSLVDASEGAGGATVPGGPRVQNVLAISSDGSHVYFVAQGILTETERPGCLAEWEAAGRTSESLTCRAEEGADNLYVYDAATARTSFVTILSANDFNRSRGLPGQPANVTPDGQFLVFLSHVDLTPDDTIPSGADQVFRYDAQSGSLLRVSIGNEGFNNDGNRPGPCNTVVCSEDANIVDGAGARPDPSMADDGSRVFFESPIGLTSHALDDAQIPIKNCELSRGEPCSTEEDPVYAQNVYEWEADGTSECREAAGCTYLISDGRDVGVNRGASDTCHETGSSVCLLGTDTEGRNVFFSTADQLVSSDTNTELDYYDARVCGGEDGPCASSSSVSPGCSGEECHGIPAAQLSAPSGGTLTFNGAGNAPPAATVTKKATKKAVKCKKGKVRNKHGQCVKRKKSKRAKKSNRRSGR